MPAMQLDPEVVALLDEAAKANRVPLHQLEVPAARDVYALTCATNGLRGCREVQAQDTIAGTASSKLGIRIYRPAGVSAVDAPALVFFHGGGWVVGSLETHDSVCRCLAAESQCCVVAVDYRLAPEHPSPAAVEDSVTAFRWVAEHAASLGIDPSRIGVCGDSAGGFLATFVAHAQLTLGASVQPRIQILFYPVTDLTSESDGYARVTSGLLFTAITMRWFRDTYIQGRADPRDVRLAPLLFHELAGMPPTLIVTCGHDPLCEEGIGYASRLLEAGTRVWHLHLADQIHGFLTLGGRLHAAEDVLKLAGALAGRELRPAPLGGLVS